VIQDNCIAKAVKSDNQIGDCPIGGKRTPGLYYVCKNYVKIDIKAN